MKMPRYPISFAAACAALATPCLAQQRPDPDRHVVVLRDVDRRPATPAAARKVLARIDVAALAACGVPSFSLREVTQAARRSPCWRDAMAGAVAQIDAPLLSDTLRQRNGK